MKRSRRYRGTKSGGIGLLIPALIVLCVVAAVALYIINDNMTFTRDGSFFISEKEKQSSEQVETSIIIEDENSSTAEESEAENNIPVALTEDEDKKERTLFVPIGSVKSEELFVAEIEKAKGLGVNKLALEVKAEDGTLAFSTKTKIGLSTALSGESEVLRANVQKARGAGFAVSFVVSCFKDNEAARQNQEYAARTANKIIWLDGENVRWLSAYSEEARNYIVEVSKELLEFIPDEMIYTNISFPVKGKTDIISYDDGDVSKRDALSAFMNSLKENLSGATISAVYENYADAYIKQSGQTAKAFDEIFETVYINRDGGKYTDGFDVVDELFKRPIPIEQSPSDEEFMIRN